MLTREKRSREAAWGAVWRAEAACDGHQRAVSKTSVIACCLGGLAALLLFGFLFLQAPVPETPVLSTLIEAPRESAPQAAAIVPKSSSRVSYQAPVGLTMTSVTFTREMLLKGNWLVLGARSPLPEGADAPNTFTLRSLSDGVVPVRDSSVATAEPCAAALTAFFTQAKRVGVDGLIVWRGALSPAQQRLWQLELVNQYALGMSLEEAVARVKNEVDDPNESEHQLGATVDMRMYTPENGQLDDRAMDATPQGRYLLENMWKYGLVKRYDDFETSEDKRYQLRYVGLAHATVMRELGLCFDDYLQLLHERRTLLYQEKGIPRYYIVCLPLEETNRFLLPDRSALEASADNLGYALVVCTLR